jgi:putative ABC transport system ATP-binding protein
VSASPVVIRGLNHYFGRGDLRRQILFDIDTEINPAEIVILTGPSGSGKTTLLTLIGALRSAQDGSLMVLGNEMRGANEKVLTATRRRIGYIFQSHNLLEALTAQQNVIAAMLGDATRPEKERRAAQALADVGLGDRLQAHPSTLSGGQRQRVAIARALASEPRLILADEPTASLDRDTGRDVVERLRSLARSREVTVVLVTHDTRILDIADRILNLEDGRLSSLMNAVTNNTRRGFELLVGSLQKGELARRLASLDETGFRALMQETAEETASLLDLTEMLRGPTFDSVAEQVDTAFSARFARQINAAEVVMYLLDPGGRTMRRNPRGLAAEGSADITFDSSRGLAGSVITAGQSLIVPDTKQEPGYDPEVDGADTRAALLMPVEDSTGAVFLVIQARSPHTRVFGSAERDELESLSRSLGLLLESWWRMGCACRGQGVGVISDCCQ